MRGLCAFIPENPARSGARTVIFFLSCLKVCEKEEVESSSSEMQEQVSSTRPRFVEGGPPPL